CTFVDELGRRCPARAFLELDHTKPRALGGADDTPNISVKCRAHNGLAAERAFGRAHIEKKKAEKKAQGTNRLRRRGYDDAKASRALRGLGFKGPQIRRALAALDERWAGTSPTIETVIREALCLLT